MQPRGSQSRGSELGAPVPTRGAPGCPHKMGPVTIQLLWRFHSMQLDSEDTLCLPGLGREGEREPPELNSFPRSLSQGAGP